MNRSFDLPSVEHLTVGTVGPPGQRTFFLQAGLGQEQCTIKIEKQQAAALAAALVEALTGLPDPGPTEPAPSLNEPAEPDWVAGTMGITGHDAATDRVTLVIQELTPEGGDEAEAASATIGMTPAQMASLAARAAELVTAGRPPCPLCGRPLDPSGHVCPKTNGHLER